MNFVEYDKVMCDDTYVEYAYDIKFRGPDGIDAKMKKIKTAEDLLDFKRSDKLVDKKIRSYLEYGKLVWTVWKQAGRPPPFRQTIDRWCNSIAPYDFIEIQ